MSSSPPGFLDTLVGDASKVIGTLEQGVLSYANARNALSTRLPTAINYYPGQSPYTTPILSSTLPYSSFPTLSQGPLLSGGTDNTGLYIALGIGVLVLFLVFK